MLRKEYANQFVVIKLFNLGTKIAMMVTVLLMMGAMSARIHVILLAQIAN